MRFFNKYKDKILLFGFLFIISFVVLMFTSKNSFLYPFNDWVDENAFFTVGKSMMNGKVPYLDIFEQKGILLYLIFGLSYLISHTNFMGVFIFEVIFWVAFLYYVFKIIELFLPKRCGYLIIPFFAVLLCTSCSFVHGGSAEEFCFPFISFSLYHFLKFYKTNNISYKEIFAMGICSGCVLLIKFTLLGLWFGIMACIFFYLVFDKKYKKAFISCFVFLLAMFIPLAISLIYFAINGAVDDFFNIYFLFNLKYYAKESVSLFSRVNLMFVIFIRFIVMNGFIISVFINLFPLFLCMINMPARGKISLFITYMIFVIVIFVGMKSLSYYFLPIEVFILIGMIGLVSFIRKYIKVEKYIISYVFVGIVSVITLFYGINYKSMLFKDKKDLLQYKFAKIIKKDKDQSLVNVGSLDYGVYTMADIIPDVYYFEKQNVSFDVYPKMVLETVQYINDRKTNFIVYVEGINLEKSKREKDAIKRNYNLVSSGKQMFENRVVKAYLYKRK